MTDALESAIAEAVQRELTPVLPMEEDLAKIGTHAEYVQEAVRVLCKRSHLNPAVAVSRATWEEEAIVVVRAFLDKGWLR